MSAFRFRTLRSKRFRLVSERRKTEERWMYVADGWPVWKYYSVQSIELREPGKGFT